VSIRSYKTAGEFYLLATCEVPEAELRENPVGFPGGIRGS
jgi:hypothetical protein